MSDFLDIWTSLTGHYFIRFFGDKYLQNQKYSEDAFSNFLLHLMRSFDWKQKNFVILKKNFQWP